MTKSSNPRYLFSLYNYCGVIADFRIWCLSTGTCSTPGTGDSDCAQATSNDVNLWTYSRKEHTLMGDWLKIGECSEFRVENKNVLIWSLCTYYWYSTAASAIVCNLMQKRVWGWGRNILSLRFRVAAQLWIKIKGKPTSSRFHCWF